MEIPTKKLGQSKVQPTDDVGTRTIELQEGYATMTALIGIVLDPK